MPLGAGDRAWGGVGAGEGVSDRAGGWLGEGWRKIGILSASNLIPWANSSAGSAAGNHCGFKEALGPWAV